LYETLPWTFAVLVIAGFPRGLVAIIGLYLQQARGFPSLRATGSRERAPDDRLREAIQGNKKDWIASSLRSSQ
jgi:hypothetical protein